MFRIGSLSNMKTLHDPVEMIQKEIATWGTPFVELDCFGTDRAERIAQIMDEFCRSHLGNTIRGYLFFASSVGSSMGVQLEDGHKDVIKVYPRIPTADDIRAYVADYETARGQPFSKSEHRCLLAHCVYPIAYGARCAHRLRPEKTEWEENTWPHLPRTEGEVLLQEATS
jgi:hypothetical protein